MAVSNSAPPLHLKEDETDAILTAISAFEARHFNLLQAYPKYLAEWQQDLAQAGVSPSLISQFTASATGLTSLNNYLIPWLSIQVYRICQLWQHLEGGKAECAVPASRDAYAWYRWTKLAIEEGVPRHLVDLLGDGDHGPLVEQLCQKGKKELAARYGGGARYHQGNSDEQEADAILVGLAFANFGGGPAPKVGDREAWGLLAAYMYQAGVPKPLTDEIYQDGVWEGGKLLQFYLERGGRRSPPPRDLDQIGDEGKRLQAGIILDTLQEWKLERGGGHLPYVGDEKGWEALGKVLESYHLPSRLVDRLIEGGITGDMSYFNQQLKLADPAAYQPIEAELPLPRFERQARWGYTDPESNDPEVHNPYLD